MTPQKELLDAVDIIAKAYNDKTTQIYNGLVIQAISDYIYEIKVNGQTYNLQKYGTNTPVINTNVKVFVPKNNWSQAFFIVGGEGTSPTGTDYNTLTNKPSVNSVTLSGNKTSAQLSLYGTGNEPPYPVTSVNGKTGVITLNAEDVGALPSSTVIPTKTSQLTNDSNFVSDANYVHTDNNFTNSDVTKLNSVESGAQVNVIETIQVNGTSLTPTNKTVNVSVPTKTSDITNDSGYITSSQAPVQSVNNKTGTVVLTQDDVGNGTTYVQTANNFTTAYKNQIDTNEQNIAILETDVTDLQSGLATETTNRQNADTALQNQINTKLATNGDGSNVTSTFVTTETFTNITSGSKLSVLFGKIYTAISNLISHIANVSNPHNVTKTQVGLGNVDNVQQYSASNPPPYPVTSVNGATGDVTITNITGNAGTATTLQTARTIAISGGAIGTATSFNGGANISIPVTSLDATKLTGTASINTTGNAATATKATQDASGNVITTTYATKAEIPSVPVQSVNGKIGAVVLTASDVGALPTSTTYVSSVNGQSGTVSLSIPTKTSDLTNDSNFLPVIQTSPTSGQIVSFDGTKWVNADPSTSSQLQSNWAETSTSSVQYIQNKPTKLSQFTNDEGLITAVQAPVQSVDGLTGAVVLNDIKFTTQTLTSTQQTQARNNIGAGTSSFSGSYTDLTNKPTIPTKTSDLTNDSGYITSSGAPVQSVNGLVGAVSIGVNNLSDVAVSSLVSGQTLEYNGTNWVNTTISTGGTLVQIVRWE